MARLEHVWEGRNRRRALEASAGAILVIALADWWTAPYVSLGLLYLFPIMLAAGFLPRWATLLLGLGCALLAEAFGLPDPSWVRFGFEALALGGCGLFAAELARDRSQAPLAGSHLRPVRAGSRAVAQGRRSSRADESAQPV